MGSVSVEFQDFRVLTNIAAELGSWDIREAALRQEIGEDAELIYAAHAPKGESGRLSRGISARFQGGQIVLRAEARDPETGYDYVRVSRFGHEVERIYAGAYARSRFSPDARFTKTGEARSRPLRGSRALNTPYGPRISVRGFKPTTDWADPAFFEVKELAEARMESYGEGIVDRIGRGT